MSTEKSTPSIFNKENYKWMALGLVVMAAGMLLMAGGKNTDPTVFDTSKVYSSTRITVAPLLILAGLVIEIFAIFKKPKNSAA
jgi:FtsH-binding integral membrane protein